MTAEKPMHATLEKLLAAGPVTLDGAWGTQLQRRGMPPNACPDGWNLTHSEVVEQVARAMLKRAARSF